MDHNLRIWQAETFALFTISENMRAHRCCPAYANCGNVRLDVIHGIYDSETCSYVPARRINVKSNIFLRIFCLEKKKLRNDNVGRFVINRTSQENYAFTQKARVNIIRPLSELRFLNNRRD